MLSMGEERRGGRHASGERRGPSLLVVGMLVASVIGALGAGAQGTVAVMSAGKPAVVVVTPDQTKLVDAISASRNLGRTAEEAIRKLTVTLGEQEGNLAQFANKLKDAS